MDSWLKVIEQGFTSQGWIGALALLLMIAIVYQYRENQSKERRIQELLEKCQATLLGMVEKRAQDNAETTRAIQLQNQVAASTVQTLNEVNRAADARTAVMHQTNVGFESLKVRLDQLVALRESVMAEHQRTREMIVELRRELDKRTGA